MTGPLPYRWIGALLRFFLILAFFLLVLWLTGDSGAARSGNRR